MLIDHIIKIFERYGLSEEDTKKHVVFLSDRGSNIKYGLLNNGFMRLTCYAHIIHNLVTAMLKGDQVTTLIGKCADLCTYMKSSGLNNSLKKSLKLYTTTRWNSIFIMIDTIIEMYDSIYETLLAKQRAQNESRVKQRKQPDNALTDILTSINLDELVKLRDFLRPFKVRNIKI